ncbi:MAG: SLBB domain-containing protein [Bacteroidota bacterium]|nr:SLBB domain-containing protein [Candidatus Kapabacteria bacterium]MDW8219965.1 SLBB domain-containing protein [Bacteroidota bacterium]
MKKYCVLRIWLYILILIGTLYPVPTLFAQGRTGEANLYGDVNKVLPQTDGAIITALQGASGSAVDNVVDAAHYFVGPGDVLSLEIVGPVSTVLPLTVSPENVILVPRLGEVHVTGKTLAQVKQEIQHLVQSRNPRNQAFLTLQRARTVFVRISGNVVVPGVYSLPASMKVSSAVAIANQEYIPLTQERALRFRTPTHLHDNAPVGQYSIPYSQRNVKVLHHNGTLEIADVVRAQYMNDATADPTLRESDEIYVPFEDEIERNNGMLSIAGAVQRPCLLPFRNGDRVGLLIKAAYGLSENADSSRIELFEAVSAGSDRHSVRVMTMARILSGHDNIELSPGMSIIVHEKSSREQHGMVSVLGEVRVPGIYPINPGITKLADIIARAGGLTSKAYLPLSSVMRREHRALKARSEDIDMLRNFQHTTLTPEDTLRYKLDELMRRPLVACDIEAALTQRSEADNIVLEDGDIITIAANPRNVFVFGQVQKPGFIQALPGKPVEWYLKAAGGFAPQADTLRVRVIKAKSRLWLDPYAASQDAQKRALLIEAGDQIYVPRIPDTNSDLALRRISAELQEKGLALQRESLEVQKSVQVWQTIFSGVSSVTGLYFFIRALLGQ